MDGPSHYLAAEQLLEHASAMLAEHTGDEGTAELVQRQAVAADMAIGHGLLAVAATLGLTADLDAPSREAWREVAAVRLSAP